MSKRPAGSLNSLTAKKRREDERTAAAQPAMPPAAQVNSRFIIQPLPRPEDAIAHFLTQARTTVRKNIPTKLPLTQHLFEIEARIGIIKVPCGPRDSRVLPSGPKKVKGRDIHAFQCKDNVNFDSGVTRTHNVHWTQAGLSEVSPLSRALGIDQDCRVKSEIVEKDSVETVYGGYPGERRVCFQGTHPSSREKRGRMEHKDRLVKMDVALPSAPYDFRIALTTEKSLDNSVMGNPPPGWTTKRVKRRHSYTRHNMAWQLDVTEVTTVYKDEAKLPEVTYEIEMELKSNETLQLINVENEKEKTKLINTLSTQLWYMLNNINPIVDVLDVEDFLQPHPDKNAVKLALAQCAALKRFRDANGRNPFQSQIGSKEPPRALTDKDKFIGCMPVNMMRHHVEEIQRSPENGYFLSEKTDGVRYLLVFTGKTAVLVDRSMKGKQPKPKVPDQDPFAYILPYIKPGTILDGEVVMHRKLRRPIFIVFDVLAVSTAEPVLHLPFEQRLQHLKRASFRSASRDVYAEDFVTNPKIALPLVPKNFVKRLALDNLLSYVVEEGGTRTYRNGKLHDHLTDGIIFQPNSPYECGTDVNLLKWKYLDTVTIDVQLLPGSPRGNDEPDALRMGVLGEEDTRVDMSRFVKLPTSELRRLEADRAEIKSNIAEVGFDPATGEWYYLTMRPDKDAPNHISTVLGTLLELAESLTTEELRYRMSVPVGSRDTYRRDVRTMQKQLLEHQRRKNKAGAAGAARPSR